MTGSPLSSLYHSVHSIYAPALLRNENGRQEVNGKVQVNNDSSKRTQTNHYSCKKITNRAKLPRFVTFAKWRYATFNGTKSRFFWHES